MNTRMPVEDPAASSRRHRAHAPVTALALAVALLAAAPAYAHVRQSTASNGGIQMQVDRMAPSMSRWWQRVVSAASPVCVASAQKNPASTR